MTEIINLTPHTINIHGASGGPITIAASGNVARVATTSTPVAAIDGIPVVVTSAGNVTGIPAPVTGTWFLVSGMVLEASGRADLCAPGSLVRNDVGQPIGCNGLRVKFAPAVCCNCGQEFPQSDHGADCACGGSVI